MTTKTKSVLNVILALVFVAGGSGLLVRGQSPQPVGTWASSGAIADSRVGAAATVLADGRTLVSGGTAAGAATATVVIYNPADNSYASVGQLIAARVGHTATLLEDGSVLIAGGAVAGVVSADLEIFNPADGTSALVGTMSSPRAGHGATRLADGMVLLVGGSNGSAALATAEVFDRETSASAATGSMSVARSGVSATRLIDNRVLVAGGFDGTTDLASAEIFNPFTQTFDVVPTSLSKARSGHAAVLLPHNNSVLIAGGTSAGVPVTNADLFLPAQFPDPYSYGVGQFAETGAMTLARANATSGPAAEGFAFVAGGGSDDAEQYRFATIKTDKDDYSPGERAVITGTGWQPNEIVTLLFQEDPAVHADYVLQVQADGSGELFWDRWAPEEHDFGVRFYLLATGSESTAQTTFTDGNRVTFSTVSNGAAVSSFGSIAPNQCVNAYVQERQGNALDTDGHAARNVALSSSPAGASFFAGHGCGGSPVTTVTISTNGIFVAFSFQIAAASSTPYTIDGNGGLAGNNNAQASVTVNDGTAPTVTSIARVGSSPTNANSVSWAVQFSESVTGVDASDFALVNDGLIGPGPLSVSGSGNSYTVTANSGSGTGTLGLNLDDNDSIQDAANNKLGGTGTGTAGSGGTGNGSFVGEVFTIDRLAPTVLSVVRANPNPTNASSVSWTVTFSETVTGVTTSVFAVAPSGLTPPTSVQNVAPVNGTTYTVTAVTGSGSGTLGLNVVDNNSVEDSVGNDLGGPTLGDGNFTGEVYTIDRTPPTVTINQAATQSDPTNGSTIQFTVVFSEPVSNFATGDVTLSGTAGATAALVTGSGTTYDVAVSGMTTDGTVAASVAAGVANDAAGNANDASTSSDNSVTYDVTPPTVTINQAAGQGDPTNASPINFTVQFDEPVANFATGDVTLGGTANATTAVVTGSGQTYNVAVGGMPGDGTVVASLAAGVATDAAGNASTASSSTDNSVLYDTTAPIITGDRAPAANANGWNNADVVVTFSCADGGSAPSGLNVNTVAGGTISTEGANQSLTSTGQCTDNAGNAAVAATVSGINIDKTAPAPPNAVRTPPANANGWNNVGSVQVQFFANGDPGASPSGIDFCTTPSVVTGETAGTDVAGTCTDRAGNVSAATTVTVRIDLTKPIITGSRDPLANSFGWNNSDVTVSFVCADSAGLAPSGIDSNDVAGTIVSSEVENHSVTNTGSCVDKAGNVADAATVSGISIDKTAPNPPTANQSPAANANGWNNSSPVVVSFANAGDAGLVQSGIDTCTASSDVSGETAGTAVPGTCTDRAGNHSTPTTVTVRIDLTKPMISGSRTPAANSYGWNNSDVTVTFSCADDGTVQSGLAVSNVAGNTVTAEGANQSVTNTGSCVDNAGNTADSATVSGINIDKTAPTITVALSHAPAASGWFNLSTGSPTANFTCSDRLSGLAGPCPSPVGPLAEGADQSVTGSVADKAGNTASASRNDIDVDLTLPVVSITAPANGAHYTLNQAVAADYACTDALSGINTCAGPVADGANFNTSSVGAKTFTVNATDVAGNSATAANTYYVQYTFVGFFEPVENLPSLNGVNAGRAIPIKWELRDALGAPILNLGTVSSITYIQVGCGIENIDNPIETADDAGLSELRLTATGYHFNWKTEKSFANKCYELRVAINDGTLHAAKFKFKK